MERWVAKLLAAIIIFVSNALAGILPIKISDWFESKGERWWSIFWSISYAHGTRNSRNNGLFNSKQHRLSIPELMATAGFFLVLDLDTVITILVSKKTKVSTVEMTVCSSVIGHQNGEVIVSITHGEISHGMRNDEAASTKSQTEKTGQEK